jgi:phage terminase large subunit-like protein
MKTWSVILKFGFCQKIRLRKRSKETACHNQYGLIGIYQLQRLEMPIDYFVISDIIKSTFEHKVIRLEYDRYNATQLIQELQEEGLNVSEFSQAIGTSAPTKSLKISVFR